MSIKSRAGLVLTRITADESALNQYVSVNTQQQAVKHTKVDYIFRIKMTVIMFHNFVPTPRRVNVQHKGHTFCVITNFGQKLVVVQLIKTFQAFYGTLNFITMCTVDCYWTPSRDKFNSAHISHSCFLESCFIVAFQLHLELLSVSSYFATEFLMQVVSLPYLYFLISGCETFIV